MSQPKRSPIMAVDDGSDSLTVYRFSPRYRAWSPIRPCRRSTAEALALPISHVLPSPILSALIHDRPVGRAKIVVVGDHGKVVVPIRPRRLIPRKSPRWGLPL